MERSREIRNGITKKNDQLGINVSRRKQSRKTTSYLSTIKSGNRMKMKLYQNPDVCSHVDPQMDRCKGL